MAELTENPSLIEAPPVLSRTKKNLIRAGWAAFALFCLIFFTFIKLPEDRLKNFIQGSISAALAPKGITFRATESQISYFLGISYTMKDISITLPNTETPIHVDTIGFSPSVSSLLFGKLSGQVKVYNAGGSFTGSVSIKDPEFSLSFKSKKLDLGKLGLLPIITGIKGSGILEGDGTLSGNSSVPSTLNGNIDLRLKTVVVDSQAIAGFTIPKISISEGTIEIQFDKAKAVIKTFRLGKPGNTADDVQATVTGDTVLTNKWDSSTLNLKAKFSLSEAILKSFVLLDAILGAGKQADGSFGFSITGPISSPNPVPLASGG